MRYRAICYAFLAFALLIPAGAFSAPSASASGPFIDPARAGNPQTVRYLQRWTLLRGPEALTYLPPPPVVPVPVVAALPAITSTTVPRAAFADPEVSRARTALPPAAASAALPKAVTARRPTASAVRHRVAPGDTLFALARRYGTTVDAIARTNDLSSTRYLRLNQMLVIPTGTRTAAAVAKPPSATAARRTVAATARVTHEVQSGDTLFALARRYGTSVSAIVAANQLTSADRLRLGQRLVIPVGRTAAVPAPRVDRRPPAGARIAMIWPSRGSISSSFGWRRRRHHDGIDLAAPWGTPIYAAGAGRVRLAGWYYGYGRAVIIDHSNGTTTLYGHASRVLVRVGEYVERGELIARVGCTGRCTGSHVHFEVRINGRAVDPLRYLP